MFQPNEKNGFSPIIVIAVITMTIVLVVGGVLYYRRSHLAGDTLTSTVTPTSAPAMPVVTESTPLPITTTQTSSIADLIGQGQSLECQWSSPNTDTNTESTRGTLWTNGKQGRSTIGTNADGEIIETNAIFKDGKVYSWVDTNGILVGFTFSQNENPSTQAKMSTPQKLRTTQVHDQMNFTCQTWAPDSSKFIIPSNIDFEEIVK